MDGEPLDEVIRKARAALHIELTRERLATFADRLASFGLLVGSVRTVAPAIDGGPTEIVGVPEASAAQAATVMNPPGAALAAAAVKPPSVPGRPDRDSGATASLSRRELERLVEVARAGDGDGDATIDPSPTCEATSPPTAADTSEPRSVTGSRTGSRRRPRTVHGRVSLSRDAAQARSSAIGMAARRDLTPPLTASAIRKHRPS